jgi:hypothetical protein
MERLLTLLFVWNWVPIYGILLGIIIISIVFLIFRVEFGRLKFAKPFTMNLTLRISVEDLSTADKKKIEHAFGASNSKEAKKVFEKIAKTSFLEYCDMISGSGTPAKIIEWHKYRLFLLIRHYFVGGVPDENEVEKIFHLGSASKSLLKKTISHYKNNLPQFHSTLLAYIKNAPKNPATGIYEFACTPILIQEMNDIIKQNWHTLEVIKLKKGTAGLYECREDTFDKLESFLKNG